MTKILNILNEITKSDLTFYTIIIALIIIAIIMFYLIYSQNKQVVNELKTMDKEKKETVEQTKEEVTTVEPVQRIEENKQELTEMQNVSKELEQLAKSKQIEVTTYEAEQEEKAIISYDELLEKSSNVSISYSDTIQNDDILVKQVDLSNTGKIELDPIKKELNSKVSIATYEHEEEFLNALKQLQNLLN